METVNAKTAALIFGRSMSTIYDWRDRYGVAKYNETTGEYAFDLIALHLKASDNPFELRQYINGHMAPERVAELRSAIGINGSKIAVDGRKVVKMLLDPTTVLLPLALRAQLFADAAAANVDPMWILLTTYSEKVFPPKEPA